MSFTLYTGIVCSLRHALCSKHNTSLPLPAGGGGAGGSSAAVGIGGGGVGDWSDAEGEEEEYGDSGFELTEVKEAACQVERVRERGDGKREGAEREREREGAEREEEEKHEGGNQWSIDQ